MSEMVLDASQLPDPATMPIDEMDVSHPILLQQDLWHPYFKRLREEDPVHYCKSSMFGAYWSVTKFNDIMEIEKDHEAFSSDRDITIFDQSMLDDLGIPKRKRDTSNFISMDPPVHDDQRKAVQGVVAPRNLSKMEGLIRQRVITILESLPLNEEFNWVEKVSIELTTQMLATLFDFPFEDRHKLPYWSDVSTSLPELGIGVPGLTRETQEAALEECLATMRKLWAERANMPADNDMDLLSMLAHNKATYDMDDDMFLGNLILLIVGGNDTTRNSITGGVLALNQNPAEYDKLRAHPELIPSMVSEIIRWQTPLSHMRRTATRDVEFRGKQIKKGDKVVMWYISGNRDEEVIEQADDFIIDRRNPRHHVSFGFGIHRCMGNRLAEMQLRVLWEEIMKRFERIEMVGQPERIVSNFIKGYTELRVKLHPAKS